MKEEYFENIMRRVIQPIAVQIVNSPEYARKYHGRDDKEEIENEIKRISEEIANRLIKRLAREGYLEEKELDMQEFKDILKEVVDGYTVELEKNEDNS